jgi:hypothetical protein
MKMAINLVAAIGFALGAAFGLAGTFVADPHVQALLWAIDGAGIVAAAALLALKCFRTGDDIVAAGFLVFAIAEAVLLSGGAAGPAASVPSFGGGTLLWAMGLLLISIPGKFALAIRLVGALAAVLFAITALRIFSGEQLTATSAPLPAFGYPVLVLTFLGWIWTLLRESGSAA